MDEEPRTVRFTLPDCDVHAVVAGAGGPTLVVAADPPNVVEHYRDVLPLLARFHQVVVIETPGFGRSRLRSRDHAFATGVTRVRALLDVLERDQPTDRPGFVLVFPCVSAFVALGVAAAEPDRVKGLVLPQAPAWSQEQAWAARVDPLGVLATPVIGPLLNRLGKHRIARKWYGVAVGDRSEAWRFSAPALAAFEAGAAFPLAHALHAMKHADEPPRVAQPVLGVWGGRDRSHRASEPATLHEHGERVTVEVFPQSGHFPELEEPERFAAAVNAFIATL